MIQVNYTAVLIAAVVNMIVGFIWYGPLFGKAYSKMMGFTKEEMEKAIKEGMAKSYGLAFVAALVMAYVFAHFLSVGNAMSATEGVVIGFWLWLGFIATTIISDLLWGKKTLNLYLLQIGYYLVVLVINGAILAVMK